MLLRDTIYQSIRRSILICEFQPGQELREQSLAERYRVSRSPVRDSLLRLAQENLVIVLPRQGYRVKPISISEADDIFGLHLVIEQACVAAAVARADDTALRALDRFRGFMHQDRVESGFVEHNRSFHNAIAELSGNTRMATVAVDLSEQFDRLVRVSVLVSRYEQVHLASAEHEAIIDALQARDADLASRLSYQHSARVQSLVAAALRVTARQFENSTDGQQQWGDLPNGDGQRVCSA
jgi:GntR family transcriptional regulator, rspAB operon transcriptional repressor